jgi:hypothetical protein
MAGGTWHEDSHQACGTDPGTSILLDRPVSGDRLELPAAVSLPPNPRCRWQVETEGKPPVARSPWTQFAILPAAVQQCLKELRPDPAGVLQNGSTQ